MGPVSYSKNLEEQLRVTCLCLSLTACLSAQAIAQITGSISGVVVDENENPIGYAEVHIAKRNLRGGHRFLQMHATDADGRFEISNVPFGTYLVLSGKEKDGYPDTKFAFYSNLVVPTVTVSPSAPSQSVTVHLGPKAGVIEIGSIKDVSGRTIPSASITVIREENNFFITMSTTNQRILVPSLTRIIIKLQASGYEDWYYPGVTDGSKRTAIVLQPGETAKIDAELQPKLE